MSPLEPTGFLFRAIILWVPTQNISINQLILKFGSFNKDNKQNNPTPFPCNIYYPNFILSIVLSSAFFSSSSITSSSSSSSFSEEFSASSSLSALSCNDFS